MASLQLVILGLVVASRLALDQLGVLPGVWEPFFGDGTERVLHSSISRALPVPDALLGVFAYAAELVLVLSLLRASPSTSARENDRWKSIAYGVVAALMALAGLSLLLLQAFVVGAWCTLCIVSACVSFAVFALAVPELLRVRTHARHSFS
jgi:uncharacterized membrane protein